jgi:rhodanese-related sulfurtransferase
MLQFLKSLFGKGTSYKELLANGAIIIDVRTGSEYDSGHIAISKNIPLDRIASRIEDLKRQNKPIICVCASGMRSGMAKKMLQRSGITAYNGGNWSSLYKKIQ